MQISTDANSAALHLHRLFVVLYLVIVNHMHIEFGEIVK